MAKKFPQKVTPIRPREQEVPDDLLVESLQEDAPGLLSRRADQDLCPRRPKCRFMPPHGHEKVQIAMSYLLEPGKDWFFPTTAKKP